MTAVRTLLALIASIFAFFGAAESAAAETRRVLLSVEGVQTPTGSSIYRYRIDTWGVEFLSLCQIPTDWELKSEKFEDPEGVLAGRADLHSWPLRALTNMYLVDVYDYQPIAERGRATQHPASFSGWVEVGSRERFGAWRGRRVKLASSNFRLKDAQRCPDPPPPRP